MELALGLIETRGLVGAIEAADAMLKAANVKLVRKERVSAGLITIEITGEVAAVKSAVDAGAHAAQQVGELVSQHIIPRPDKQISELINELNQIQTTEKKQEESPKQTNRKRNKEEVSLFDEKPENEEILVETTEEIPEAEEIMESSDDSVNQVSETALPETEETEANSEDKSGDNQLKIPPVEELENLNVHDLRHLARSIEDFPIFGRDISKANRRELLDHFISILK